MRFVRLLAALTLVGLGSGYIYARSRPLMYTASAVLQFVPARISPGLVDVARVLPPLSVGERMLWANRLLLSDARLQAIINEVQLYKTERKRMVESEVIQLMRSRIAITASDDDVATAGGTMTIRFSAADPEQTVEATEQLTAVLLLERARDHANRVESTSAFIEGQLRRTEDELVSAESQLSASPAPDHSLRVRVQALENNYKDLLSRLLEAKAVANVERFGLADTPELVEFPRLPQSPNGLSRAQLTLIGGAAGVAAALAISILTSAARWRSRPRGAAPASAA